MHGKNWNNTITQNYHQKVSADIMLPVQIRCRTVQYMHNMTYQRQSFRTLTQPMPTQTITQWTSHEAINPHKSKLFFSPEADMWHPIYVTLCCWPLLFSVGQHIYRAHYMLLPIRLCVTRVDQSKTVEIRIKQFSPYSCPIPLVVGAWNKRGVDKMSYFLV